MKELCEIVVDLYHGFDYKNFFGVQPKGKLNFLLNTADFFWGLLYFRELAFYDALKVSDSADKVLSDEITKTIARELVESVKNFVTSD